MDNNTSEPKAPLPRHQQEYQDPHFHDDDSDVEPRSEIDPETGRVLNRRKPSRRVPPRRRYYED